MAGRCSFCGKDIPICTPPYHRGHFDKVRGKYVPATDICMCDKEQYKFMIVGAINWLNKRKRLPLFTDKELEELYNKKLWEEVNKGENGQGDACGECKI